MNNFRKIKLSIGAFVLMLTGFFANSCHPDVRTCYKTTVPENQDTTQHRTIMNSCYDMPAEPADTTTNQ